MLKIKTILFYVQKFLLDPQSADDKVLFEDILIDWRDFSQKILLFSRGN